MLNACQELHKKVAAIARNTQRTTLALTSLTLPRLVEQQKTLKIHEVLAWMTSKFVDVASTLFHFIVLPTISALMSEFDLFAL